MSATIIACALNSFPRTLHLFQQPILLLSCLYAFAVLLELTPIYYISGKDNKYHISLSLLLPTGHSTTRTYHNTLNHKNSFKGKKKKVSLLCKYFPLGSNSHPETDFLLILIGLNFRQSPFSGRFLHIKLSLVTRVQFH